MTRPPSSWAPARAPFGDDWGSFAEWVSWFDDTYEVGLPGCWALHSGLVHQLEALWHLWRAVYEQPKTGNAPAAGGPASWHVQYLYPFLDHWRDGRLPGAQCRAKDKHRGHMPERVSAEAGLDLVAADPVADGAIRGYAEHDQFRQLTSTLGSAAVIGVLHPLPSAAETADPGA